jgi:hypothetical protein
MKPHSIHFHPPEKKIQENIFQIGFFVVHLVVCLSLERLLLHLLHFHHFDQQVKLHFQVILHLQHQVSRRIQLL